MPAIRDLLLTSNDPAQSLQELKFQWAEMAAASNDVLNKTSVTRTGVLVLPEHAVSPSISATTTMSIATRTLSVVTSGLTVYLPAAGADIIGQNWTVNLGTPGSVTVACSGSDTLITSTSATDTSVTITTMGDSITFRCLTATSWIMV